MEFPEAEEEVAVSWDEMCGERKTNNRNQEDLCGRLIQIAGDISRYDTADLSV